ncbi:MAG: HAMP domain-containing histidine kinase [Pegethrix bostrychoides GSE-TBD4-15B]|jgi:signal transduction histidine kinase|uniref:histidine kinase n=1 Tax=Pegethrix bostrychoides GSE-TBD4-15B TaxID=2839662 RepID=A0A951U5H6_9CYAN|nr:HAMP domain-containing histidine kinase [Pegethrix bostrychoides GSE-TBD4-15B]
MQQESRKAQILVFIEQSENHRLLVEYLKQFYEVTAGEPTAQSTSAAALEQPFDLCILDGMALTHLWPEIQARKQREQPVLLPVLLVTARPDVNLITRNLWESIDELITQPIQKTELRVRIEMLLRSRRFSLQLNDLITRERELNDLKSHFIAITSHEFRNPLNTILGFARLLEKRDVSPEQQTDFLQRIQRAASRTTLLLDDVLTMIRTESSPLSNPTAIAIEPFCQQLVEEIKISLEVPRIVDFSYSCEANSSKAQIDETLLRQILINLLSNALKYSPVDSIVYLTVQHCPESVTFEVKDQGVGISENDQQNIFEAFYRTKTVGGVPGTGLGLAIVKQAIARAGGTISLVSELNGGTTFTVVLPIAHCGISENL